MAKISIVEATTKLYDLLSQMEAPDRKKVLGAVSSLLDDKLILANDDLPSNASSPHSKFANVVSGTQTEKAFFDEKKPRNKIEELAVAARYREINLEQEVHSKEELEAVVKQAKRNFDAKNFSRDLNNGKTKGVFARDKEIRLSYVGQEYVDTLPNYDQLKSIKAGKKTKSSKKNTKKA